MSFFEGVELLKKDRAQGKRKLTGAEKSEAKTGLAFLSPWMIGFVLFYLLPMIASFGFSLFDFNPAVPDEAKFIGFDNWYRALVVDEEVRLSFFRTIRFMLISLPITLAFTLFLAVLMNSEHVVGKNVSNKVDSWID